MNKLLLITGVMSILFGCNSENDFSENDLEKENLKGEVLYIHESELSEGNDIHEERYIEYNQLGYKVTEFDNTSWSQCFYNKNKLIKVLSKKFSYNTSSESTQLFLYDKEGHLIKKRTTDKNNKAESYSSFSYENKKIRKETKIENGKEVGYVEFYYSKNIDSTIQKDIINLSKVETARFEVISFNENGQKIMSKSYWLENGTMNNLLIQEFSYDNYGNEVKNIVTFDDQVTIFEMKYEYDSHGNWIKCIREGDGKIIWTKTRNIYYINDDISDIKNKLKHNKNELFSRNSPNQKNLNSNKQVKTKVQQHQIEQQLVKCKWCLGRGFKECGYCRGSGIRTSGGGECFQCPPSGLVECGFCRGTGYRQ